jgi:hypothetical protein
MERSCDINASRVPADLAIIVRDRSRLLPDSVFTHRFFAFTFHTPTFRTNVHRRNLVRYVQHQWARSSSVRDARHAPLFLPPSQHAATTTAVGMVTV